MRIHLGTTYRRRSVTLYAQPADGGRHRVLTGTVNRQGDLTASVAMNRNTKFYADFTGDPRYDAREVSVTAFQRADSGRWVNDGASPCIATSRHGVGVAYFHPPHPKLGVAYALEAFFDGDAEHCWSRSGFKYLKFTAAGASSRAASAHVRWKGAWTMGR